MDITRESIKGYCDDVLFNENDVFKFVEALESILNSIGKNKNCVKHLRYLRSCFTNRLLDEFNTIEKYIIIPSHKSPAMYLAQKLYPPKNFKVGVLRSTIKNTVSEFGDKFIKPKGDIFSASKIQECLELSQLKLNTVDYIEKQHGLIYILIFDHSHKDNDSVFEVYKSGFSTIKLFPAKNEQEYTDPCFVFLHELGHRLHHAITGDVSIIPDFFKEFTKKFSTEGFKVSELFAHFFATAVLNETHLAKHSPFYDDSLKSLRRQVTDLFIKEFSSS